MSYDVTIWDNNGRETRPMSVFSRLLKDRILFIGTPIDENVANLVIAQLLYLQMEDPKNDIHICLLASSQIELTSDPIELWTSDISRP